MTADQVRAAPRSSAVSQTGEDAGRASDRDLLAAHVAGDPEAFGELVRLHTGRLWAVALRTLGDPDEAADALQDAVLKAYRAAGGYRGDAAVTTWLHRIVVNACLDRVRLRASRPADPLPAVDPAAPRDDHAATEARLDVTAALAQLPEHQRLAVVLVDLQDLSVAEAAQVLEVAQGTVKSRCARGRAALVELLVPPRNREAGADVAPPRPPDRSTEPVGTDQQRSGDPA